MKHLETIFPELHNALKRGYTALLHQHADGSISCKEHPEPNYYDYQHKHTIYCTSHPAILYLYESACGMFRGVIVHYEDIIHY